MFMFSMINRGKAIEAKVNSMYFEDIEISMS